eukprot:m.30637 g.30637  ORF g.30637 m.30637 type:complete len:62 (+) comp9308_c0_seq1:402-587(+)
MSSKGSLAAARFGSLVNVENGVKFRLRNLQAADDDDTVLLPEGCPSYANGFVFVVSQSCGL